ncbi:MAG TPA: trigger factor [Chloroflexota bacterium]|nr:trigger factor [Chloroflexota bacterium]
MKVSSTELPSRQVSLAIEVEQDRLDRAMDDAFRRLAGRVDVPGFRRGKAPRSMVERMIGRERIVEEALDHLLPEVVSEAIEQEKVEPYTRPRVESVEFEPLRLKAIVGLAPKVELGDYQAELRVPSEEAKVDDEQVDGVIQRLRESYAQWAPVERPVQLGDRVGIDLHATVEGAETPLLDSKEAEYVVDPEGAQPAPGFAEQLVGLSPDGQKAFTLSMPEDYRDKEVAGKPAQFDVTLHWVKERELPALDEAFAQQVGEYADVAGLRTAVETQLRDRETQRVREELEEAVMSKLVEISTIEFPPQLAEHQAQHMLETFSKNVEQQGLQLQQYLRLVGKEQDTFEQEIRVEAENRVRRSLALDAFADAEQIDVEQEEIADEVHRVAADSAEPEAVEKLALANPTTMQRVQEVARERKAMARLIELATGDGRNGGENTKPEKTSKRKEKTAEPAETSDTDKQSPEASAAPALTADEERGTA